MAKTKIKVSQKALNTAVEQAEQKEIFSTLRNLCTKVSEIYNCSTDRTLQNLPEITPSIVYLRMREWNIQTKTQPARKVTSYSQKRMSKTQKFQSSEYLESLKKLKEVTPQNLHNRVNKVKKGSLKSAVELKCLDCSGYVKKEVKNCCVYSCALWCFRPF